MSYQENVFSLFEDRPAAERAVQLLLDSGFAQDSISLVASSLSEDPPLKEAINAPDRSEKDAAIGAGAGSAVGAMAGISIVAATGLGAALVAAGPIVGAGMIAGAFLGAMTGWGVHGNRAEDWERKIHEGHVLVVAHGDALLAARAYRILQELKPLEIHHYSRRDDASKADE